METNRQFVRMRGRQNGWNHVSASLKDGWELILHVSPTSHPDSLPLGLATPLRVHASLPRHAVDGLRSSLQNRTASNLV